MRTRIIPPEDILPNEHTPMSGTIIVYDRVLLKKVRLRNEEVAKEEIWTTEKRQRTKTVIVLEGRTED